MKKNIDIKEILIPSVSLFVICVLVTALLAITNDVTAPKIEALALEQAAETRMVVLPTASEFEATEDESVYMGIDSAGNLVGYAISVTQKGYGGEIEIMVGINSDGSVSGVSILSHNETPGLGANATKDTFLSQYKGASDAQKVTKDGGEIDSITGATITSRAVTNAVNSALEKYNAIEGGAAV